jgi:carboxylesterase type B
MVQLWPQSVITGLLGLLFAITQFVNADNLTVRTLTGVYTGLQNPNHAHVREFRNIPYAQAPVGKRRWMPPVAVPLSRQRKFSTRFPPSCPQYMPSSLSLWNTNISDFMINTYGQSKTSGAIGQSTSEDCLSLAVWTPLDVQDRAKLPVAFFVTGGSFQIGGIDVPYQLPPGWVERSQKHIVVTINYRVNIFGFPNAAGLDDQNLGFLDQRMALEWVYANIASFGGDPDRITMWGHSAGGVSADVHNYAWCDDPLVSGYFMQSGSAFASFWRKDETHSNFTFVAKNLGCDFAEDPIAEIECMRQVPLAQIMNFVGQYGDNKTTPSIAFRPSPDGRIVFENYTDRANKGLISKVPALVSFTANEESSLYRYPVDNVAAGPNKTAVDKATVDLFVCMTSNTTTARAKNNLTTYRFQYAGNFSNITPLPWMGAYHGGDIPLIFGTFNRSGENLQADDFQTRVAHSMQDYVFAFIADPESGLREKGWMPHNGPSREDGVMYRFGTAGRVEQNASTLDVDRACFDSLPYNSSP